MTGGFSAVGIAALRNVAIAHDVDIVRLLPIPDREMIAVRLARTDTLVVGSVLVALVTPVAEAAMVVTGRGVILGAAAVVAGTVVAARVTGRLLAVVLFRAILRVPDLARGPVLLGTSLLSPILGAGAVLVVGATVVAGDGSSATTAVLVGAGHLLTAWLLWVALALLVTASCALATWFLLGEVDLGAARSRLSTGPRWRDNRPFSGRLARVVAEKDLRVLLRRGPAAWDAAGGLLGALPGLATISVGLSVLPAQQGSASYWAVLVSSSVALCGFVAIAGESLADLSSMDTDGPIRQVLRVRPAQFARLVATRAARHATAVQLLGMVCVLTIAVGTGLPPAALLGLTAVVVLLSVTDAACLTVGSARYPALLRPTAGQPELEPQVRLITSVGSLCAASVGGAAVLLFGAVPLPAGGFGYALAAVGAAGLTVAARPLARRVASTAYLRWEATT